MSSPQDPARKGGPKAVLLALVVLALAGGGMVVYARRGQEPEPAEPAKRPVVVDPGVVALEPMVLNLADPTGNRYIRLTLRLVLDQRAVAERADESPVLAKLRDRILALIARKRSGELTNPEGKEALREELRRVTEELLAEAPFHEPESALAPARVLEVCFTEFLVQ